MLQDTHPVTLTLTARECDNCERAIARRIIALDTAIQSIPRRRWPASVKAATFADYTAQRVALSKLAHAINRAYAAEHARTVK